jgi:hypothetical protein
MLSKSTIFLLIAILQASKPDGTKLQGYMLYPHQFANGKECSFYLNNNNRELTVKLLEKLDKDYIQNRNQPIWIPRSFVCVSKEDYDNQFYNTQT